MIYGIGVDMVRVDRMAASLDRFGQRIAEKVLTGNELEQFRSSRQPASFLAKRFAAKEALAKALGTGFRDRLSLKHIEVTNNAAGRPGIVCNQRAQELLNENMIDHVYLSLADERDNALAFVVLECRGSRENG
ncbi:MAG: holo-ACP synthase [Gammaproteobacteria bacterium]|nr:holo-ACP synthase [Gammaproteobacteria bacterium]